MEKNFNDMYKFIYTIWNEKIRNLKIKKYLFIFISIILLALEFIIAIKTSFVDGIGISYFIILGMIIKYIYERITLKQYFEKIVIRPIVELCNSEIVYNPTCGITVYEYNAAKFNKPVDNIESKELIVGQVTDRVYLKMSQVKAVNYSEIVTTKYELTDFEGLFGYCELKVDNISPIKVEANKRKDELNINRLEMDSIEFEKIYDVFAENKIQAMQILNSEVIELINKFNEETGNVFNLIIDGDKIFFRITCKELFEKSLLKGKIEYAMIYRWYKMIQMPIDILDKIVENIEHINQ